jgi:hypothetical protein
LGESSGGGPGPGSLGHGDFLSKAEWRHAGEARRPRWWTRVCSRPGAGQAR